MSALANLVTFLLSTGMAAEHIGSVITLAQQHANEQIAVHRNPPDVPSSDKAAEKRKAWDRDRKRLQRGLRLSDSEWIPLVAEILKRDGYACTYCSAKEDLTADHVVPLTRGGTNDRSNLTACCIPCNTKKSNKLVSEWLPNSSTRFHADVHQIPPDNSKPPLILTSLSSTGEILEERKKSSGIRARARGRTVPEDWQPPERANAIAAECGTTVPHVEAIFRDYLKSSGKLYADHDAAFCNFVRNQQKFQGNKGQTNGRRTVHDAARDLHEDVIRRIAELDAPAPTGLRDGTGQGPLRLLPPR